MKNNKHFTLISLLGSLSMIGPFNIDTCLPAFGRIANDFGVTFSQVEINTSLFFFGFGIGQLYGGYISDLKGRKWVVSRGLGVSMLASLILVTVNQLEVFYLMRFVQAIGAGFVGVSVAAIVRDNFQGKEAASVMSMVAMIAMGAPLIAPSIGALLLSIASWKAIFIFIAVYGLTVLIFLNLNLEEKIQPQRQSHNFFQGIKKVYQNVPALAYMAAMAIPSGALYTYLTSAPFIFQEYFGLGEQQFAILFGVNGFSLIIMNKINSVLVKKHGPKPLMNVGLTIHFTSLIVLLIIVSVFTPTLYNTVPFITLHVSTLGLISGNATSVALEKFEKHYAGIANSQMRVVGIIIGAVAGAIASLLNNGTLYPILGVMITCSALGIFTYMSLKKKAQNTLVSA
ncbi:multidrug effflux MFS transporter [Flammeovirga sp. EKP202]|uniref:multidrug effflux MFS transporter n=1 Tax=Flammeovirga sp. EKP202 TaxID=2770592 RepID=UPI00165FE32A|nr:multidrug effflux MFS transporter [Flammeovirga sp. EKP202]MBD0400648.1 multidrug effflux MFS transporter [Flammeovirga sp. EKP202]